MRIKYFIISLLMAWSTCAFSQTMFGDTFKSKIYVGGNFGLNFGTISMLELSPMAGFNFTERLSAGLGFSYIYFSDNRFSPSLRFNMLGGRTFARFLISDQFFFHAEYERMSFKDMVFLPGASTSVLKRVWVPAIPIGLGYRSQVGANSFFTINLLYDVLSKDNVNTLYPGGLLYRMGFIIGLY
jgi:hypothetical protein